MRKVYRVVAVVGAALGLLALGTVMVAGPPPGPPPPEPPQPPPKITPQQIIDGVNQLIPLSATTPRNGIPSTRMPPPPPELAGTPVNRIPITCVVPREGTRLSGCRSLDDGSILGRGGATALGAIELERDYKLGSDLLPKGFYGIAAISDPEHKLDKAIDPENKIDFYLAIVSITDLGGGQVAMEIVGLIGLPHWALARVMAMVDPQIQIEFAQVVLLNLIAALLQ